MIRVGHLYCLILCPFVAAGLSVNAARIGILGWEVADALRDIGLEIEHDASFGGYSEKKLFAEIRRINDKLDNSTIPIKGYLSPSKSELGDYFVNVSRIDNYYQKVIQNQVKDLANEILLDDVLLGFISNTNSFLAGKGDVPRTALLQIYQYLQKGNAKSFCEIHQSNQQVLFNFYESVMASEIKAHVLVMFAMYYKSIESEDFAEEILNQHQKFEKSINVVSSFFRKITTSASRRLYRCDPRTHKLGETYESITKLIQGYIINEQNLSPNGNCQGTCPDFKFVQNVKCAGNPWCDTQPRCDKILNCQTIRSNHFSVFYDTAKLERRYEYVNLHDRHIFYGNHKPENDLDRQSLQVFKEFLFWDCEYCFCLCDNPGRSSDRYISLRSSLSNFNANRVVTGVRFVKHNRIIHLQVQEGKLLKFGEIDQSTVQWAALHQFKILDRRVYEGQDYHILSFAERRLDLDDLVANPGHAIIGVRFIRSIGHLKLEIMQVPFDFETGNLRVRDYFFKKNSGENRLPVALKYPDIPTKSPLPYYLSGSGRYIEFTSTDLQKDVGQTTVPFFDFQPVVSSPAVPLSGIGVFHKGRYGYGGFIALKIVTYDMSRHIDEIFL